MLLPTVASPITFSYAIGNTPAVSLTRAVPHGVPADVLVLGSGDLRNLLYTAYVDRGLARRKLDITLCDYDAAITARNAFILSLILSPSGKAISSKTLWNIVYHQYVDESAVKLIESHAEALIERANTPEGWRASPFGSVIRFCDTATLAEARVIWEAYRDAAQSPQATVHRLRTSLNEATRLRGASTGSENTAVWTGMNSASPMGIRASVPLSERFAFYWKNGTTTPRASDEDRANPLLAATLSKHSVLHYGSDPLHGFHLAQAFTPLTSSSPLTFKKDLDGIDDITASAQTQFAAWTAAFREIAGHWKVRFVTADALAFCHTLQHFKVHKQLTAGWYRTQYAFSPLELDEREYGRGGKQAAPSSFDAIDSSNLVDHLDFLNVLVGAGPLLKTEQAPWATLHTEMLLRGGHEASELLNKALCGDAPTICFLLGLSPVEYWTNATEICGAEEELMAGMKSNPETMASKHLRLAWKSNVALLESTLGSEDKATASVLPCCTPTPEQLVNILHRLYLQCFAHENVSDLMGRLGQSPQEVGKMARRGTYAHFHRGTMAVLCKYIIRRFGLQENARFIEDASLAIGLDQNILVSNNYGEELFVWMHLLGLTKDIIGRPVSRSLSLPRGVVDLGEMVSVTFTVPRPAFDRLFDKQLTLSPTLQASLEWPGKQHLFSDLHIAFGKLSASKGEEGETQVSVESDPRGWEGGSDLVVSFSLATDMVRQTEGRGTVALQVQTSLASTGVWISKLGMKMEVYSAALDDAGRVFFTKNPPGQTRHRSACEAAAVGRPGEGGKAIADGETSTTLALSVDESTGTITSFTARTDILSEAGKGYLRNKEIPIEVVRETPFTLKVLFGKNKAYPRFAYCVTFPLPVAAELAKTRIARTSAWIEVIAPLAHPSRAGAEEFAYPTVLSRGPSPRLVPAPLGSSTLSLDALPVLDLDDKAAIGWLTSHASFQFSARERALRDAAGPSGQSADARLNLKESLFTMFMLASGLQGGGTGAFAISVPGSAKTTASEGSSKAGIHILIFVSALRLDGGSGTVVLDAAAVPLTMELLQSGEANSFLAHVSLLQMARVEVEEAEMRAWRRALPAMAERCRTWEHGERCEYRRGGEAGMVPLSMEPGEPLLCSCGRGKFPGEGFVGVPEWEEEGRALATRVAISPLFALGCVEELLDPKMVSGALAGAGGGGASRSGLAGTVEGGGQAVQRCHKCGKTEGAKGGPLKRCMRCLKVRYCGAGCQKADWRTHRMECEESEEYANE